ncbi:MAG: hypothetical protein ACKO3R_03610 [bacterium]
MVSEVIAAALKETRLGGATAYNPMDIPCKEGLIETLREKAEKQGASFPRI